MAGLIPPLAGLKLAILRHSPSGLRRAGTVAGVAGVLAAWAVALAAGSGAARAQLLMLTALVATAGWLVGPSLASGTGVLRPEFFTLLPAARFRFGSGLLATGFVGTGPAVTLAALAAAGVHAVALDPASLAVAVPGVLILLAFMVVLSRLFFAAVGAAMHSRFGVEVSGLQYGVLVAALVVGWLAFQLAADVTPGLVRDGLPAGAGALAVLPSSWPVRAVEAAAAGGWGAALGWLGALAALTAALAVVAVVALTPRPRPAGTRRRRWRRRVGAGPGRRLLPDTPLGAVVGKELRLWWRDPWRRLELRTMWWAGVIVGVVLLAAGHGRAAALAGLLVALGAALCACNLYGQDGTALWQLVAGAGPGTVRADVRGRQVAVVVLVVPPAVLLSAGFGLLGGSGAGVWPLVLALLPAVVGAGSGMGLLLSVVAATPGVDPQHRIGPNDAGDVTFQVWTVLLGLPVLVAPAAAAGGAAAAGAPWPPVLVAVLAGVVNGAVLAWWLGRVAHRRLADRLPETFARIRYGHAAAPVAGGGGWLDRAERSAVDSNKRHTAVGS